MKQFFSFIFLIFSLYATSQVKSEFGPESVPAKDQILNEVLGGNESYIYVHKTNSEEKEIIHYIQKVDRKTLLPVESKEIILEENDYKMEVNKLAYYDDELVAFVTKRFKRTKTFILTTVTYDLNTLTKIKETQLETFNEKPIIEVKASPDQSKVVIKRYAQTTDFLVYDMVKGSKIWEGTSNQTLNSSDPIYRKANVFYDATKNADCFETDNDGNIHYAFSKTNTGNQSVEDLHYTFISINNSQLKDHLINADYLFNFYDPVLSFSGNKKVLVSCIFAEYDPNKTSGKHAGFLNCTIDNGSFLVLSKKFTDFSQLNSSGDQVNNPKKLSRSMQIDESHSYGNATVLIGHKERNIAVNQYNSSSSALDYTIAFHFDFFVVKVNQNSEIEFFKQLPFRSRINHGVGPPHLLKQYVAMIDNDYLFLFQNEHPETTKIIDNNDKESELFEVTDGAKHLVCNKLNLKDGVNSRSIIEMPPKNKFNPIPELKYQLGRPKGSVIFNKLNKTLYLPIGWGGRMERILKVNLE